MTELLNRPINPLLITRALIEPKPHVECPVCGVMDFREETMRVGWCSICMAYTSATPFAPDLDVTEEEDMDEFLKRLKEWS